MTAATDLTVNAVSYLQDTMCLQSYKHSSMCSWSSLELDQTNKTSEIERSMDGGLTEC